MKRTTHLIKLLVCLLPGIQSFSQVAYAQDSTKTLSLDEAISVTMANNKELYFAVIDERIAASKYNQLQSIFLPRADFSYTAMSTNNPLNAFGFKLQQRSITQNDFNPDLLNHPSATPDYMARLEVLQPLVNMDMIYQRKSAEKQTEVYQYKTRRTKEYITFEVQKAYLQLALSYKAVSVLEEALQFTRDIYTYTDNHYNQGLIQKSDVLNAQVQVSALTSDLDKANSDIRNASGYLSLLMGEKPGTVYKTTDPDSQLQQFSDLPHHVSSSRADFMAIQKGIDASAMMIKSTRMNYLPKLNAFGSYQYNDSRLTGFGANSYLMGLQLTWNIFNGNRTKNTIAQQKLERDKLVSQLATQKNQSQLELDKAYRDLADSRAAITRSNVAIEQAAEALRILQNRYEQGLVNTTDVLLGQTQLSQQKFSLAKAQFTAHITQAYLQFLTTSDNK